MARVSAVREEEEEEEEEEEGVGEPMPPISPPESTPSAVVGVTSRVSLPARSTMERVASLATSGEELEAAASAAAPEEEEEEEVNFMR